MSDLEIFWIEIRQFLNVMLGFRVQDEPNLAATLLAKHERGEDIVFTCVNGFAERVICARSKVECDRLPTHQKSLFMSASERFDKLLANCGCPDLHDLSRIRPPSEDDPHYRALKVLATERIPTTPVEDSTGRKPLTPPLSESRDVKELYDPDDLVTLDEMAASVHKGKRTLERRKTSGTLPAPVVEGGGGKADHYYWPEVRLWLMKEFGVRLPDSYFGRDQS